MGKRIILNEKTLRSANAKHDAQFTKEDIKIAKKSNNRFYKYNEKEEMRTTLGTSYAKRFNGPGPNDWEADNLKRSERLEMKNKNK